LTWQGLAGLAYPCSPSVTVNCGYRYMKIYYDDSGFTYDMTDSGLHAGTGFRF
jgi:opacity protein-like surface antigen